MIKALAIILAALVAAAIAARFVHVATADHVVAPAPQPWSQEHMDLVAWNDSQWRVWIRDGRFELEPREEGVWRRHRNTTIAFKDWNGAPWQAKVEDGRFLLAPRGEWRGRVERADALRYRDWSGEPQLRTVAQLDRSSVDR